MLLGLPPLLQPAPPTPCFTPTSARSSLPLRTRRPNTRRRSLSTGRTNIPETLVEDKQVQRRPRSRRSGAHDGATRTRPDDRRTGPRQQLEHDPRSSRSRRAYRPARPPDRGATCRSGSTYSHLAKHRCEPSRSGRFVEGEFNGGVLSQLKSKREWSRRKRDLDKPRSDRHDRCLGRVLARPSPESALGDTHGVSEFRHGLTTTCPSPAPTTEKTRQPHG